MEARGLLDESRFLSHTPDHHMDGRVYVHRLSGEHLALGKRQASGDGVML